ncbi:tetratricopeptide repeat protein [Actinokineospora sp. NPDC004072]
MTALILRTNLAELLLLTGDPEGAERAAAHVVTTAREHGLRSPLAMGLCQLGGALAAQSRHGEAEAHLAEAIALATAIGARDLVAAAHNYLATSLSARGDHPAAEHHHRQALSAGDPVQRAIAEQALTRLPTTPHPADAPRR